MSISFLKKPQNLPQKSKIFKAMNRPFVAHEQLLFIRKVTHSPFIIYLTAKRKNRARKIILLQKFLLCAFAPSTTNFATLSRYADDILIMMSQVRF